jgi:hypothetical protein
VTTWARNKNACPGKPDQPAPRAARGEAKAKKEAAQIEKAQAQKEKELKEAESIRTIAAIELDAATMYANDETPRPARAVRGKEDPALPKLGATPFSSESDLSSESYIPEAVATSEDDDDCIDDLTDIEATVKKKNKTGKSIRAAVDSQKRLATNAAPMDLNNDYQMEQTPRPRAPAKRAPPEHARHSVSLQFCHNYRRLKKIQDCEEPPTKRAKPGDVPSEAIQLAPITQPPAQSTRPPTFLPRFKADSNTLVSFGT